MSSENKDLIISYNEAFEYIKALYQKGEISKPTYLYVARVLTTQRLETMTERYNRNLFSSLDRFTWQMAKNAELMVEKRAFV